MPVIRSQDLAFRDLPGRSSADPLPPGLVEGCSARIVRVAPGARTPHRHPRSGEVVYVVSGRGTAWEDGTRTPLRAGDMIVLPAGAAHATAAAGEPLVLVCFFPHGDLSANLEELDAPRIEP